MIKEEGEEAGKESKEGKRIEQLEGVIKRGRGRPRKDGGNGVKVNGDKKIRLDLDLDKLIEPHLESKETDKYMFMRPKPNSRKCESLIAGCTNLNGEISGRIWSSSKGGVKGEKLIRKMFKKVVEGGGG